MVAIDTRGQVYVADRENNRVEKFDHLGHLISIIGTEGSASGQFRGPRGVAVDGLGDLYVADSGNNRIQKFDPRAQPCSLTIRAVMTVNHQLARRVSDATLGLGVERRSLRVALPGTVLGALRQHRRVRISVSVAPTGFGGPGPTVTRRSLMLSI
jgi:hypothetical protein